MVSSAYEGGFLTQFHADRVPKELLALEKGMIDLFEESAGCVPGVDAIRYFDETISYSGIDDPAEHFATLLATWGVKKGDSIAVHTQNNPRFLHREEWKESVPLHNVALV